MTHLPNPTTPDLWTQRVDQMGLRLEDSPTWPLIERLYAELADKGLDFRPPCYVANEWGCPDGLPLIGIPFYLVDPRLHPYEEEHADDLEDAERIMAGLRHEAGHAINYAYRLYDEPEWTRIFGDFFREYDDDYRPLPFSRRFVRHLPGWYAQKHPDEDFAETFAVWLTPGSAWREKYADWPALAKLEYVEQTMRRIGRQAPVIDPATVVPDPDELSFTVADFYAMRAAADAPPVEELGAALDADLREIFRAEGIGTDAATLVWDRRQVIMRSVSDYVGARMYVVKALLDHVVARLRALALRAAPGRELDAITGVTALASTLVQNFVTTGHFLEGIGGPEAAEAEADADAGEADDESEIAAAAPAAVAAAAAAAPANDAAEPQPEAA